MSSLVSLWHAVRAQWVCATAMGVIWVQEFRRWGSTRGHIGPGSMVTWATGPATAFQDPGWYITHKEMGYDVFFAGKLGAGALVDP